MKFIWMLWWNIFRILYTKWWKTIWNKSKMCLICMWSCIVTNYSDQLLIFTRWAYATEISNHKMFLLIRRTIKSNYAISEVQSNWLQANQTFRISVLDIIGHPNWFLVIRSMTAQLTYGQLDASSRNLCWQCLYFQAKVELIKL